MRIAISARLIARECGWRYRLGAINAPSLFRRAGLGSVDLGWAAGRNSSAMPYWDTGRIALGGRAIRVNGQIAQVAAEMVPYATTALGAYGGAVLAKAENDAADATVGFGRRLLQRVFGRGTGGEPLPLVLAKVAASPEDPDYLGMLRAAIRDALESDAQMLAEVREILVQARPVVTGGSQSAQADHGGIAQNIVAGGNVDASHTVNNVTSGFTIWAGRDVNYSQGDMTVNRAAD